MAQTEFTIRILSVQMKNRILENLGYKKKILKEHRPRKYFSVYFRADWGKLLKDVDGEAQEGEGFLCVSDDREARFYKRNESL